jgi:hypothetical protein
VDLRHAPATVRNLIERLGAEAMFSAG